MNTRESGGEAEADLHTIPLENGIQSLKGGGLTHKLNTVWFTWIPVFTGMVRRRSTHLKKPSIFALYFKY
jgi:hypothetical protein